MYAKYLIWRCSCKKSIFAFTLSS